IDAGLSGEVTVVFDIEHQQVRILAWFERASSIMTQQRVSAIDGGGRYSLGRRHTHLGTGQCNDHLHIVSGALLQAETGSQRDRSASTDQCAGRWMADLTSAESRRRRQQ